MRRLMMIVTLASLVAACGDFDESRVTGGDMVEGDTPAEEPAMSLPPEGTPVPSGSEEHPGGNGLDDAPIKPVRPLPHLDRVPEPPDAVVGEAPPALMAEVMADASSRTGVATESIEVLRAQFVQWSDGSLGCPEPGMMYTQAIEPGYWVELRAGERTLDYRLTERGYFKLCESMFPLGPGGGDGTDGAIGGTLPGPPDA
jgi:hypothetical protein